MDIFKELEQHEHEQVIFCNDPSSGLRAIIAIHNTVLGPAVGGTRMRHYASDDEALQDALRLSRSMTYKAAISGLNLGGGKAVIIADPTTQKTEPLLRSFGRYVQSLAGRYITAEDVGTTVQDMEIVRMETDYVTGISRALGGSGDPSPVMALGIYEGIKACAKQRWGTESLEGVSVAVQGLGHIGYHLCQHLYRDGAQIFATDPNADNLRQAANKFSLEVVAPEEIYACDCDIFSPCALGGVLDDTSIAQLKCQIVAGGANNQLVDEQRHAAMLAERDILYAPDYVINAGGLINVANEFEGYDRERAVQQAAGIYEILQEIFAHAGRAGINTVQAANHIAEQRIQGVSHIKRAYLGIPRRRNTGF